LAVEVASRGPHPCRGALVLARITNRSIARKLRIHESYVSRMLSGREPATPEFRRFVSRLLRTPQDELFYDEDRG
jgi:hypothetical protein